MELGIFYFQEDAKAPTRQTEGSVGYDLFAYNATTIQPGSRAIIGTGIGIILPTAEDKYHHYMAKIESRSGLSARSGIEVGAGVIDVDYTGEIKVILHNFGDIPFEIRKGDRIAQLVIQSVVTPPYRRVQALLSTVRGESGFGSTGLT